MLHGIGLHPAPTRDWLARPEGRDDDLRRIARADADDVIAAAERFYGTPADARWRWTSVTAACASWSIA
jgi:hypothetical protein